MENLVPLSLVIGDRNYRVKVKTEDEEAVRRTARIINEKIVEYKTEFAGKDIQDYIAMVLIWFATEKTATTNEEMQQEALLQKLDGLEKMIDAHLAN